MCPQLYIYFLIIPLSPFTLTHLHEIILIIIIWMTRSKYHIFITIRLSKISIYLPRHVTKHHRPLTLQWFSIATHCYSII